MILYAERRGELPHSLVIDGSNDGTVSACDDNTVYRKETTTTRQIITNNTMLNTPSNSTGNIPYNIHTSILTAITTTRTHAVLTKGTSGSTDIFLAAIHTPPTAAAALSRQQNLQWCILYHQPTRPTHVTLSPLTRGMLESQEIPRCTNTWSDGLAWPSRTHARPHHIVNIRRRNTASDTMALPLFCITSHINTSCYHLDYWGDD